MSQHTEPTPMPGYAGKNLWRSDTGWICPKCNRVFSPETSECAPCNLSVNRPMPQMSSGRFTSEQES